MPFVLILSLTLAAAPFLNGAANDWGWAVVAGGLAAAAVAAVFDRGGPVAFSPLPGASFSSRHAGVSGSVSPAGWWWIALLAVVGAQAVPLPHGVLRVLSPARARLAEEVAAVAGPATRSPDAAPQAAGEEAPVPRPASADPGPSPLSFTPEATALAFYQILALAVLFHGVARIPVRGAEGRRPPGTLHAVRAAVRARPTAFLLRILVASATAQAALVLVQYAARLAGSAGELPFGLGRLTGTYVNRNGLGNLLALAIPMTAGLLMARVRKAAGRIGEVGTQTPDAGDPAPRLRARLRLMLVRLGRGGVFWLALALTIQMAGVVLSLSRGGMGAAAAALALLLLAAGFRFRGVAGPLAAWGVPLLLALAVGAWLGLDAMLARWASLDVDPHGGRLEYWEAAWGVFRLCPVLGAGLGGYRDVSTAFRGPAHAMIHVEHAHCDYAEALAVLGVPGGLLAAAALALLALGAARSVREGNLRRMGLSAGLFAFAGHAAVDFPLAYGANVAWAVCAGGLLGRVGGLTKPGSHGAEEAGAGRRPPSGGMRAARRRRGGGWLRLGAALAGAVAAAPPAMAAFAEAALGPAREAARELREQGRLKAAPKGAAGEAWRAAFVRPLAAAEEAAAGRFHDAEALRLLAALLAARAAGDGAAGLPPQETEHARRRARAASAAALALRPASAEAWLEHAWLRGFVPDPGPDALRAADAAMEAAARLAPAHPRVAHREAVYWLARDARPHPGTPAPEDGLFRRRAQSAYRRLLSLNGVPGPERFILDAWRRSGSMAFVLGCIPPGLGERTARCLDAAERLAAESGRPEDMERVESARGGVLLAPGSGF